VGGPGFAHQGTEGDDRVGEVEERVDDDLGAFVAALRPVEPVVQPTLSRLANGQDAHTLFITCGDARLVPNLITTSGPGDCSRSATSATSCRPDSLADDSVSAAIEFAVGVLTVREVVVCGHSNCGAMKALVAGPSGDMPALSSWLRHAESSLHVANRPARSCWMTTVSAAFLR
jgi:carbonic anhydrase